MVARAPHRFQLTLRHFILKQRILNFYRSAIRASRAIPDHAARKETITWIRQDIEHCRASDDTEQIERRLLILFREIRQVLPTLKPF